MSLYNKYRPVSFDEIVGNNDTVQMVKEHLINKNHNHSILFTGESGTGKTTMARILARKIFGISNDEEFPLFDWEKINAGDHRGIDTIRKISSLMNYRPRQAEYKIFFFDECHACTREAQDALLTYMEDHPNYVYFMFATTEPDKLKEALVNRCAHYELDLLDENEIIILLKGIISKENTVVETHLLQDISTLSKGSPRKAINFLEDIIFKSSEKQEEIIRKRLSSHFKFLNKNEGSKTVMASNCQSINNTNSKPVFTKEFYLNAIETLTCTSTELLKKEFPPKQKFMSPFLSEGSLVMIYAPAGAGKTMFIESIVLALTRTNGKGITIGKLVVEEQCGVMILDGEMDTQDIQGRVKSISGPMGDENPNFPLEILTSDEMSITFKTRMNLASEEFRKAVTERLEKHPFIKVLILDNLSSLMPGISENSMESYAEVNQWLLSLRSLKVAVIIIHHSNKNGGFRGHSSRIDNLDVVIGLKSLKGADDLCFEVGYQKFRGAKKGEGQKFVLEAVEHEDNHKWLAWKELDVESSEGVDRDVKAKQIMAYLLTKTMTQDQIRKLLKTNQSTVSNYNKQLTERGYLTNEREVTEAGQKLIQEFGPETEVEKEGLIAIA